MTAIFSKISAIFMAVVTFFGSLFGLSPYNNNLDIDLNKISSFVFTSELTINNVGNSDYSVMQGGCSDGTYAYYIVHNPGKNLCSIVKYQINSWKEVKRVNSLKLDHGNDMVYNPNTNKLVVVHNAPNRTKISFVNPDTLQIEKTFTIPLEIYSITYNRYTKKYAVGISYGYNFAILDSNFKVLSTYKGNDCGFLKQGMDSDNNYIYFILSGPNVLAIYDWEGKYYGTYNIGGITSNYESENIFHINDTFYVGYNRGYGRVYKMTFSAIKK